MKAAWLLALALVSACAHAELVNTADSGETKPLAQRQDNRQDEQCSASCQAEIDRLRQKNEQLRQENEQLHKAKAKMRVNHIPASN